MGLKKKFDIALKLMTYDLYCSVCNELEIKPCSFGEYVKRVMEEANDNT